MPLHVEQELKAAFSSLLEMVIKNNEQNKDKRNILTSANGSTFKIFFIPDANDKIVDAIVDEMDKQYSDETTP